MSTAQLEYDAMTVRMTIFSMTRLSIMTFHITILGIVSFSIPVQDTECCFTVRHN